MRATTVLEGMDAHTVLLRTEGVRSMLLNDLSVRADRPGAAPVGDAGAVRPVRHSGGVDHA